MSTNTSTFRTYRTEQGFTLVEIMVAMAIGMLGIIIMMQMFHVFEGQKRTTTGGDDAQNIGSIAMYGLQQTLQQAGYCFSDTPPTKVPLGTLKPVIIDATPLDLNTIRDTNTNTIIVSYGNDSCPPQSASGVVSAATMNVLAYAVKDSVLKQCDYANTDCADAANWFDIADDVVSMKAECSTQHGIRLALVVRNSQLEKNEVTASAPVWAGTSAINLNGISTDGSFTWKNYRYKTFEALIPIRNAIWTGVQGC